MQQVELSGAVSSQYLTALLMAAPLATGAEGITIKIRDELVSQPYVDMTVRLMERFGIQAWLQPFSMFEAPRSLTLKSSLLDARRKASPCLGNAKHQLERRLLA